MQREAEQKLEDMERAAHQRSVDIFKRAVAGLAKSDDRGILQTALRAWARVVESVSLRREVDQKVLDVERAAQKKSADMFKRTVAGMDTNE